MDEIFQNQVNFEHLLKDVFKLGWAFVGAALTREFVRELRPEIAGLDFEAFYEDTAGVRQEFEVATLSSPFALPAAAELAETLGCRVRQAAGGCAVLHRWQPNQAPAQRYSSATAGIQRHRDYQRDKLLVASFTVAGAGQIFIYPDRYQGGVSHVLETGPGSLLLLRAPGLTGQDDRPTHSVEPPLVAPRISLTYRMVCEPEA